MADYVALREIFHNDVRAFHPGDGVTQDQVDNLGLKVGEDVAKPSTKAAQKAAEPAEPGKG